jgi:hypothetical protein
LGPRGADQDRPPSCRISDYRLDREPQVMDTWEVVQVRVVHQIRTSD